MSKAIILLVEDDKVQAKVTKDFLESFGYEVILAADGKSAIKSAKTQKVDIIVLDLVLPDINGNEVSRWLKLNPDTKGIPIIMLTVRSSMTEKVAGLVAGADDYLPKPYDEIELNARNLCLSADKGAAGRTEREKQATGGGIAQTRSSGDYRPINGTL